MPSAISDFITNIWRDKSISRETKLQFLKEPLEGLKTLHAKGIMHRDIRLKNMLIMSVDPPHAVLCDFGKAIEAKTDTSTSIGTAYTLAPEVWTADRKNPYTAKIDTWAYGYVIAEVLGYKQLENTEITRNDLKLILAFLRIKRVGEPLVDLVSKLLVWNPQDRWSAAQALEHPCWLPIQEQKRGPEDPEEAAQGKKVALKDPA